ncbi:helix-turn-helix domain-containing protein [Clostridium sp. BNL1100]|uniref:helix-turn-helix domain-containing protein n=1 Tax=Clostridium sp. BNL1100 TaxID=755731 RepID=UPI00024A72AF|nr:helix-turn-helix domain-containing protein [Clostridium sp. BNL1100]AEY66360.1 hypothetical protein Clo1100_2178 [Clostridium sp. BNL1100]
MGENGFTVIPNYIFEDENLNKEELLIVITLIRFNNKVKGYAFPSYKQLKNVSKVKHDKTLINSINGLVRKGYLKKETVAGIGNKYFILTSKIEGLQKCSTFISEVPPTSKIEDDLLQKCSTTNTNTNTNTNTKYNNTKIFQSIVDNYTTNPDLRNTINEFIRFRQGLKKPIKSEYALNLLLKKLDRLADNEQSKIDVLNQSILNSWQGIFTLKEVSNQKGIKAKSKSTDSNQHILDEIGDEYFDKE